MDSFSAVVAVIDAEAKNCVKSQRTRAQFATELALAATVRIGYLVDVLAITDTQPFGEMLRRLREIDNQKLPQVFASIVLLHDPILAQTFFVNVSLLLSRYRVVANESFADTQFIRVGQNNGVRLASPPGTVVAALADLVEQCSVSKLPVSIIFPITSPTVAVPLAALLLEYPIAYVPEDVSRPVLSHVPLNIFQCFLNIEDQRHNLLKFSCPADLDAAQTQPDELIAQLRRSLEIRVSKRFPLAGLDIERTKETMERVAL